MQNVRDYEEVVNAYNSDGGFSIFITGSNSYLLSGELMTKLTGRYVEFEMFTLSFSEFLDMKRFMGKAVGDARIEFDEYLRYGGFPRSLEYEDPEAKARYIEDVVGQIVDKDIRSRNKIRNIDTFNRVMPYAINNYGAPTSLTNLHDRFTKTERIAVERRTIAAYIQVSMTIADRGVEERGYRPFGYIREGARAAFSRLTPPLLQGRDGVRRLKMASFMQDGGDLI